MCIRDRDKLYAHQAIQDSIVVKDEEVKEKMNQQIDYMVEQLKSMENVVKYFKKNNEDEFKTELFEILKQQKLASEMQKKIIDPIQITPEETRNFFKKKMCIRDRNILVYQILDILHRLVLALHEVFEQVFL